MHFKTLLKVIVLLLVIWVIKLKLQLLEVDYCNIYLQLQQRETNSKSDDVITPIGLITQPHAQEIRTHSNKYVVLQKSTPIKSIHGDRFLQNNVSLPKPTVNYKTPGNSHPFMLISDVTIDKFHIIPDERRHNYKYVYGIPTVARPQNEKYLIQTLNSLFQDVVSIENMDVLIIIMVADLDTDKCGVVTNMVKQTHSQFIDRGMLEIICPHPSLYPSLADARRTLGDPEDRFMWRSKQNLDFAFLMWYASSKAEYYIQLEDDIIATERYAYYVNDYVERVKDEFWYQLRFSDLGFIGKLMRNNDLLSFAQYLLLFYTNKPCDWLLYDYGISLVCYEDMEKDECIKHLNGIILVYTPSLFQHMGTVSSLEGKSQILKDSKFKEIINKRPTYANPRAMVTTTFPVYNYNSASSVYNGEGVFWSNMVLEGNDMVVEFYELEELKGIKILTGSEDNPQDILQHGVVEYKQSEKGEYEFWGDFEDGKVKINFSETKSIHSIRVRAVGNQTNWLIISHFECWK